MDPECQVYLPDLKNMDPECVADLRLRLATAASVVVGVDSCISSSPMYRRGYEVEEEKLDDWASSDSRIAGGPDLKISPSPSFTPVGQCQVLPVPMCCYFSFKLCFLVYFV